MTFVLLIAAVVMLLCVLFNKLTARLGMPMLFAFILLGMVFGSDGIFKIPFSDFAFAEQVCSAALIFIMFYGGFGTRWNEAKPVAVKSVLLSTLGVVFTALLTGLFCHFALGIELLESFLIGSVIGSTDAASVFSILRSKRLGLTDNTASMLEMESGSNDPCSYMLTVIVLAMMGGGTSAGGVLYLIFAQVAYGVVIGVAVAFAAVLMLKRFEFATAGFDSAFVLAVAVLSYALTTMLGGNGYLSVYLTGIIMGNSKIPNKKSLVNFFDGIMGLMQMLIFFLLGLLSFPSHLPEVALTALAIALFLTFAARPLAVFAILTPMRCRVRQQLLVSFAGLRGAASIVFAIMVTTSPVQTDNDLFHIVFFIVLLSILFQGSLIPFVAGKLKMLDPNADVLKTFSDYREEVDVQFMELNITDEHPWKDKAVRDITTPPDTLLVMLLRDGKTLVPNGDTVFVEGDIAVLSAPAFRHNNSLKLYELTILPQSRWCDKKIVEFSTDPDQLVLLIKRHKQTIIPNGNTVIRENDVLVMNSRRAH